MSKKKMTLFGENISPACSYCEQGKDTADGSMILCSRVGIVSPYYRCRKFVYSPIRRKPRALPKLPDVESSNFKL
ncbi:MAG: hypothetical protein FWG21_06995 [Oscillospiraceae bacterium]|nr:hypothetical protein [Oscillospiraceae bacterium]